MDKVASYDLGARRHFCVKVCETINKQLLTWVMSMFSNFGGAKKKKITLKRKIVQLLCAHPLVIRYGCPVRLFVFAGK